MTDFAYCDLDVYRQCLSIERLIVGVSGGRSSGYQMAHLVEAAKRFRGSIPPGWVFVFENTSLERWETYDFIRKLDDYFLGGALVILEWDATDKRGFRIVTHDTLKREGEIMHAMLTTPLNRRDGTFGVRPLPNPTQRTCTANLKIKTAHRYVRRALGWPTQYYSAIGYRADEKERCDNRWLQDELRGFDEGGIGVFPMFDAGVDVFRVDDFWSRGPFDLEMPSIFGNCDLCFMVSMWKIKERMLRIALEDQLVLAPGAPPPLRVARWIAWEERVSDRPGTFRKDRPPVREIWNQVCAGNFDGLNNEGREDRCGSCTD